MAAVCLLVPTKQCQRLRDCLRREGLLDEAGRLKHDSGDDVVAVPVRVADADQIEALLRKLSEQLGLAETELTLIPRSQLSSGHKIENARFRISKTCREVTAKRNLWCDDLEQEVPTHWEKHNDLALFPETAFGSEKWHDPCIADELWPAICSILGVRRLARKSAISNNDYRSPKVDIFFGSDGNSWVSRKENGIVYHWDILRSMFSAGNITEKLRIAEFDCKDEVVVDLFAGIGYFTLPYLVHAGALHVHACEWNPAAVEALRKNLQANQVEDRCTVHSGDNRIVCPRNVADRVNLGLLPSAEMSYLTACLALKEATGGFLHIHANVRTEKVETEVRTETFPNIFIVEETFSCENSSWNRWCFSTAEILAKIFGEIYPNQSWSIYLVRLNFVKSFAPHVAHLVLDLKCSPVH